MQQFYNNEYVLLLGINLQKTIFNWSVSCHSALCVLLVLETKQNTSLSINTTWRNFFFAMYCMDAEVKSLIHIFNFSWKTPVLWGRHVLSSLIFSDWVVIREIFNLNLKTIHNNLQKFFILSIFKVIILFYKIYCFHISD